LRTSARKACLPMPGGGNAPAGRRFSHCSDPGDPGIGLKHAGSAGAATAPT